VRVHAGRKQALTRAAARRLVKPGARPSDSAGVDVFTWVLVAAVPVLYGLFWWLDYRWLAYRPTADELAPVEEDPD
jgi:hypothetical protein